MTCRLSATRDDNYVTANIYDGSGNRAWTLRRSSAQALAGELQLMWQNGHGWVGSGDLNLRSWYQSEHMTLTDQGYTKHYFIEGQRIASKLGTGFAALDEGSIQQPVEPIHSELSELPNEMVTRLGRDFECLGLEYRNFYGGSERLEAMDELYTSGEGGEPDVYFYHSDHLGSSSFITDGSAFPTQHLQYLPFGEDFIHQQNTASYYSPFTFSGKERDMETSLSYFGARYYDAGLSLWLSVDPLSDKYPSLSAYNYCALNPVMLVDPDGRELDVAENESSATDLLSIVSPANRDRVIIENGKVSVNTEGLSRKELRRDKGLSLINEMVKSDKKFLFESVEIGQINDIECNLAFAVLSFDKSGVINASNGGKDSNGRNGIRPADGYDGHVLMSSSGKYRSATTGQSINKSSVVFHELAENYFRTHFGYDYNGNSSNGGFGAHYRAEKLEGSHFGNPSPGNVSYKGNVLSESQKVMFPYIINSLRGH